MPGYRPGVARLPVSGHRPGTARLPAVRLPAGPPARPAPPDYMTCRANGPASPCPGHWPGVARLPPGRPARRRPTPCRATGPASPCARASGPASPACRLGDRPVVAATLPAGPPARCRPTRRQATIPCRATIPGRATGPATPDSMQRTTGPASPDFLLGHRPATARLPAVRLPAGPPARCPDSLPGHDSRLGHRPGAPRLPAGPRFPARPPAWWRATPGQATPECPVARDHPAGIPGPACVDSRPGHRPGVARLPTGPTAWRRPLPARATGPASPACRPGDLPVVVINLTLKSGRSD